MFQKLSTRSRLLDAIVYVHNTLKRFLPYLKIMALAFLIETLDVSLCLSLAPHVQFVPLLDTQSVLNSICEDIDVISKHLVTLNHVLFNIIIFAFCGLLCIRFV